MPRFGALEMYDMHKKTDESEKVFVSQKPGPSHGIGYAEIMKNEGGGVNDQKPSPWSGEGKNWLTSKLQQLTGSLFVGQAITPGRVTRPAFC
jgi:hypothetical protein